jgi:hypothetical protein
MMSMGRMISSDHRLVKRMGLRPYVVLWFFVPMWFLSTTELLARGFDIVGTEGDDRMRWRTCAPTINSSKAANEETTHTWRIAA